jgi:peptidoglycan/xylan/chitin deacetylase (PgdA/CDA1 family)
MIFALSILLSVFWFTPNQVSTADNKEVICFVYHRFGDSRYPSTNVSLEDFRAHLEHLKANKFQVLTFEEAIDYLKSDKSPRKTAVITIDDGYKSFFKNGLPLLQEFGFPATLYINTETVGGSDYMDWRELAAAKKVGIEIGNHTHSHAYFLDLPVSKRYDAFEKELKQSQLIIKENLGSEPTTFAYPYGELDYKMQQIVEKVGFKGAAAQNSGVVSASSDLMRCPRFPMSEAYADLKKFIEKSRMHGFTILSETPKSFLLSSDEDSPELTLEIANENLLVQNINCFIQGSGCDLKAEAFGEGKTKITIRPTTKISIRRRTLYTITAQDQSGDWHWFSHLWIAPK